MFGLRRSAVLLSRQLEHWSAHKTACKEAAALKTKKKRLAEEEDASRIKAAREAVTNPPCAFCGMASFETCTNCMATHYCNRACQVKHWPIHKVPCKISPIYRASQELAALKETLAEQEQTLGVDHEETLRKVNKIGVFLKDQGKLKEAEVFWRRALEGSERIRGPDHPDTLTVANNLGMLLCQQGQLSLAELFLRRSLEGGERTLGRDHPVTLSLVKSLGGLLYRQGKFVLAEPYLRRALEGHERTLGRDHLHTLQSVSSLKAVLEAMEKMR